MWMVTSLIATEDHMLLRWRFTLYWGSHGRGLFWILLTYQVSFKNPCSCQSDLISFNTFRHKEQAIFLSWFEGGRSCSITTTHLSWVLCSYALSRLHELLMDAYCMWKRFVRLLVISCVVSCVHQAWSEGRVLHVIKGRILSILHDIIGWSFKEDNLSLACHSTAIRVIWIGADRMLGFMILLMSCGLWMLLNFFAVLLVILFQ